MTEAKAKRSRTKKQPEAEAPKHPNPDVISKEDYVYEPKKRTLVADSRHDHKPITLSAEDQVESPFTDKEIANILEWQHSGIGVIMCPNPHSPEQVPAGEQVDFRLVPTVDGLECGHCGYRQGIVPAMIADGSAHAALVKARTPARTAANKRNARR